MHCSSSPRLFLTRPETLGILLFTTVLLAVLGVPDAHAAACGSALDFNGTYATQCVPDPTLTTRLVVRRQGQQRTLERTVTLYCRPDDPRFVAAVERLEGDLRALCLELGGGNCAELARDFAAGLRALNGALVGTLPRQMEVQVHWRNLAHLHRMQAQETYANGGQRQAEYTLDNSCERRGRFVGLAVPVLQGGSNQHGSCLLAGTVASEGQIDPRSFQLSKKNAADGSLTCTGNGTTLQVGLTFEGEVRGGRS